MLRSLTSRITLGLFMLAAAPTILRAAPEVTYYVDQNVGTGTVTGTIVTNGGMKPTDIEIFSWSFGVTSPSGNGQIVGGTGKVSASDFSILGHGLSASTTNLFYDFDNTAPTFVAFVNPNGFEWCIFTDLGCGDPPGSGELISLGGVVSASSTGLSGDMIIGTATPEPGTKSLVLLGVGFLMMTAMRKRIAKGLRRAS